MDAIDLYMAHFYRVSKNTNQKDAAGTSMEKMS